MMDPDTREFLEGRGRKTISLDIPTTAAERVAARTPEYDSEQVAKITAAVREADQDFESSGGSSRHWVRECLLPRLTAAGLKVVALAICLLSFAVFAQDIPVDPAPVAPIITGQDVTALTPMVLDLIGHAKSGRVALAVVALLILLSQLVLRFGQRIPGSVGQALGSTWARWLVPQVLSILGALGTALATGAAFSLDLVIGAVLLGLAGGGIGSKAAQVAAAEEKGKAAAAAVDTKAEVVATLEKGPPSP